MSFRDFSHPHLCFPYNCFEKTLLYTLYTTESRPMGNRMAGIRQEQRHQASHDPDWAQLR